MTSASQVRGNSIARYRSKLIKSNDTTDGPCNSNQFIYTAYIMPDVISGKIFRNVNTTKLGKMMNILVNKSARVNHVRNSLVGVFKY